MQLELYKERTSSNENAQQQKAMDTLQQLIQYINDLTEIMNRIKLKNEAEFVVAYQNHMKKIKAELSELRSKTEEQQNFQTQNRVKISNNDNEITYFREECLKLYEKVEQKGKENYELKFKIQELQKSNDFLESQIKVLMKKVKQQGADKDQNQVIQMDQTFCTATPAPQKFLRRRLTDYQSKVDMNSSLSRHHYSSIRDIVECEENKNEKDFKQEDIIDKLTKYVTLIEQKYQNQTKILNQKVQKLLLSQNKKSVIRSDLENFFLDCVETVRREIMKKRPLGNNQQLQQLQENTTDFSQFYKEDKLKVLELVVSNEKILVFLYQKLFPNHVNLVLQSIKEDQNLNIFLEQSVKQTTGFNQQCEIKIDAPRTTREVRSVSLNRQLEVRKGKLLFKQY